MQEYAFAAAAAGGLPGWLAAVVGAVVLVGGIGVGYVIRTKMAEKKTGSAEETARRIVDDAKQKAETMKKQIIGLSRISAIL